MTKIIIKLLLVISIISTNLVSADCQSLKTNPAIDTIDVDHIIRYGFVMDQDMFMDLLGITGKNQDRNYTMGMTLFFTNKKFENSWLMYFPKKLSLITYKATEVHDLTSNGTLSLGVTAFTPRYLRDNIRDSLYFIINDRPFSSLTFLSTKHQLISNNKIHTSHIVIGFLGLSIAEKVQTHIHKNHWFGSTRDIPSGWKYQLSNGGEPTFLISNKVDRLLNDSISFNKDRIGKLNTQFILSTEYRLGYYTGMSAGLALRFGILDPNNWVSYDNYQLDFANQIIEPKRKINKEFYLTASLKPNIIIYNAHLQGQFKENFHQLSFNEINNFVIEGSLGIGSTLPLKEKTKAINFVVYLSGRTAEFKTDISNRTHVWGGIQVSFIQLVES